MKITKITKKWQWFSVVFICTYLKKQGKYKFLKNVDHTSVLDDFVFKIYFVMTLFFTLFVFICFARIKSLKIIYIIIFFISYTGYTFFTAIIIICLYYFNITENILYAHILVELNFYIRLHFVFVYLCFFFIIIFLLCNKIQSFCLLCSIEGSIYKEYLLIHKVHLSILHRDLSR